MGIIKKVPSLGSDGGTGGSGHFDVEERCPGADRETTSIDESNEVDLLTRDDVLGVRHCFLTTALAQQEFDLVAVRSVEREQKVPSHLGPSTVKERHETIRRAMIYVSCQHVKALGLDKSEAMRYSPWLFF